MKKAIVLFVIFPITFAFAQLTDPFDPPRPNETQPIPPSTLPQVLASGANYYSYIPITIERPDLIIDNQSQFVNNVLLVAQDYTGQYITHILEIDSSSSFTIPEHYFKDHENIYLISMQPFHVYSKRPVRVLGLSTRHFTTMTPSRQLELIPAENSLGKIYMIGVTPDGNAHYPVYGMKFGTYDQDAKIIEKYDGEILEAINRQ